MFWSTFNEGIYASRNVCVKDIDSGAFMVLQNNKNFIEMTSNMIYIVALGVGVIWNVHVKYIWTHRAPLKVPSAL